MHVVFYDKQPFLLQVSASSSEVIKVSARRAFGVKSHCEVVFFFFFSASTIQGGLSWPPTRYFIAEKCNHKTFKAPPMQFSDKRKDKLGEETRLGNRERILSYEDLLEFFRH